MNSWRLGISIVLLLAMVETSTGQTKKSQPGFGTIEGQVLDRNGRPVKSATVVLEPLDCNLSTLLKTKTDEKGRFAISGVPAGINLASASKEEDGFPNSIYAPFALDLNDQQVLPRIVVRENQTTSGVVIHLPEKGWMLRGAVVNAETGALVRRANVKLIRADNPNLYYSTGLDTKGQFEFTLPVRPFIMEASAEGFQTWRSEGNLSVGRSGQILSDSGSTKDVIIMLKPQ